MGETQFHKVILSFGANSQSNVAQFCDHWHFGGLEHINISNNNAPYLKQVLQPTKLLSLLLDQQFQARYQQAEQSMDEELNQAALKMGLGYILVLDNDSDSLQLAKQALGFIAPSNILAVWVCTPDQQDVAAALNDAADLLNLDRVMLHSFPIASLPAALGYFARSMMGFTQVIEMDWDLSTAVFATGKTFIAKALQAESIAQLIDKLPAELTSLQNTDHASDLTCTGMLCSFMGFDPSKDFLPSIETICDILASAPNLTNENTIISLHTHEAVQLPTELYILAVYGERA